MKPTDWISVKDKLPEVDENVMVYTTKGKMGISSMYISKDQYGNILGDKKWRGDRMLANNITHWKRIVMTIYTKYNIGNIQN